MEIKLVATSEVLVKIKQDDVSIKEINTMPDTKNMNNRY